MSIRLKVARSEKELEDVFRFRHHVYVTERGKFSQACGCSNNIVDKFDAMPSVANVVAYEGDEVVASMRINRDSPVGLPAEEYFDFSATREAVADARREAGEGEPVFVSGSMLAIHQDWRNRRNVIFALFKMAAGVMHDWGATHVIGSISKETLGLYGRLGFEPRGVGNSGPRAAIGNCHGDLQREADRPGTPALVGYHPGASRKAWATAAALCQAGQRHG